MDIINPVKMCAFEFHASNKVTIPLQSLLISQSSTFPSDIRGEQYSIKHEIYRLKSSMTSSNKTILLEGTTTGLKRSIELASEKGASNWLFVLPLQEHSFSLHKIAFHDSVALRYMVGSFLCIVPVELSSLLNTLLHVPRVNSHPFATMRSMT